MILKDSERYIEYIYNLKAIRKNHLEFIGFEKLIKKEWSQYYIKLIKIKRFIWWKIKSNRWSVKIRKRDIIIKRILWKVVKWIIQTWN